MKPIPLPDLPKKYHEQVSCQLGHAAYHQNASPALAGLLDPLPESVVGEKPLDTDAPQKRSSGRAIVHIERRGTRLLDADNLAGCKFLVDRLRYEGLIENDNPEAIELIVTQKKVARGETETVVQITYP